MAIATRAVRSVLHATKLRRRNASPTKHPRLLKQKKNLKKKRRPSQAVKNVAILNLVVQRKRMTG